MLSAAPQAKGLSQRAISESGGSFAPPRVADGAGMNVAVLKLAESAGESFMKKLGAADIKAARAFPAEQIQKAAGGGMGGSAGFWPVADGNVLPGDPFELYEKGRFNDPYPRRYKSNEGGLFMRGPATSASLEKQIRSGYGERADVMLKAYPHSTDAEQPGRLRIFSGNLPLRGPHGPGHECNLRKAKERHSCTTSTIERLLRRMARITGQRFLCIRKFWRSRRRRSQPGGPCSLRLDWLLGQFLQTGDARGTGLPQWPVFKEKDQKVMFF